MGWKDWNFWLRFGLTIGIIFAIVNILLAGIPGIKLFVFILTPFVEMTTCIGEGCWLFYSLFGSILFLVSGILIGWIIGKIRNN